MSLTDVTLCGKTLCSPVIAASGTFGFGGEHAGIVDMKKLGGISGKGLTLEGKYGNEGERLWETPAGLINSIGLQNPGVRHFIEYELPGMKKLGPAVLANLGGSTIETYEEGARLLDETNVDFIELNISCPNVKAGGIAYGVKAESAREVVSRVRACTKKPLIVKLSPNAENITEMALACEAAGALQRLHQRVQLLRRVIALVDLVPELAGEVGGHVDIFGLCDQLVIGFHSSPIRCSG